MGVYVCMCVHGDEAHDQQRVQLQELGCGGAQPAPTSSCSEELSNRVEHNRIEDNKYQNEMFIK